MNIKNILNNGTRKAISPQRRALMTIWICTMAFSAASVPMKAQSDAEKQTPQYARPSWWFGIAGGGNLNFYNGSTQRLTEDLIAPVAFHSGLGLGLFAAPLVEFHPATSNWGFMLQAGYDSRRGTYNQEFSPCNCPRDLSVKVAYVTAEPSLRFAPFKSDFYVFAGPRVAYNLKKQFVYQQGTNPDYPDQVAEPDIKGDLSAMKPIVISGQVGLGYDIQLSSSYHKTQWVISPFASFQPYFGQSPRTIETWNITTVRAGVAVKLGTGRRIESDAVGVEVVEPIVKEVADPTIVFTTNSPQNVAISRNVREVFPLRNYVFFDLGSTEIPSRYVLLRRDQVQNFEEKQVQLHTPKDLGDRAERQMTVYYNVLNILGDRMVKNPASRVTLVGSSDEGPADGLKMAESVQRYLVDIFRIDISRIKVEGRTRPALPSEQGGTLELDLLRQGDRRVTIESSSPALLMEFTNGAAAPLKPVEILTVQEAPLESYVSFDAKGADDLESWSLKVTDENGTVQHLGPYTQEKVSIPGKEILGNRTEGTYTIEMIGLAKSGNEIRKSTQTHLVAWTPPVDKEVMRFSVIYEFNDSKAISMYDQYLREVVVPKIPNGGKVIIHGYTDVIGGEAYNQGLSLARANDVKSIIAKGLAAHGRTDVRFEVLGFGEDPKRAQFGNKLPEERFYNRSVIIDILPAN